MPEEVWDVLLDFKSYGQWNPFHSKVDIVEQDGVREGTVAVKMTVNMGPILGAIVSTETIWYVDSSRHILAKEGQIRSLVLSSSTLLRKDLSNPMT